MKRLIALTAVIGLVGLGVGAAYAQTQYMPAGPFVDYVDIGDYLEQATSGDPIVVNSSSTEISHNLQGWGAIQPFWSNWGNYGSPPGQFNQTGENCRAMVHVVQNLDCTYTGSYLPPTGYPCLDPCFTETGGTGAYGTGDPWATLDMNFGSPGGTKTLHVRHLDGGGGANGDNFDVYVNDIYQASVTTQGSPETWEMFQWDVSAFSGTQTVKFVSTSSVSSYTPQWGLTCIDQVGITIENTDPVIAPVAVDDTTINCSGTKVVNFHYTPGSNPDIRGYSVWVQCDADLTFGAGDISFFTVPTGVSTQTFVTEVTAGSLYKVDYAIMGGSVGIDAEADLFSVTFHGAATGTGVVSINSVAFAALDGTPITGVVYSGTDDILVDCAPPDVPTMDAEPTHTQGLANTVSWSDESASGAAEYYVERATDAGFTAGLANSGWIAGTSHPFAGLADAQIYYYRVKSRDALDNESVESGYVFSTQDDTAPTSSVDALPAYETSLSFDVAYASADATSGVDYVKLYYQADGGGYVQFGATFSASPISFTAPSDGAYDFYTVATDVVTNEEGLPAPPPDASTIVDTTPPDIPDMDAEPAYTQGLANTVSWSDESASGAAEYYVERATDAGFTAGLANSGWIAGTSHGFSGLTDGQIYYYRVKSRDAQDTESAESGSVFSTQDDTAPTSSVDALPTYETSLTFDVAYTADDATSGVDYVKLYYQVDEGGYVQFGTTFSTSPISFTAPSDGDYDFYTVATDVVTNEEGLPTTPPDASTIVDTTAPATHVDALGAITVTASFTITYTLDSEAVSGLGSVDLWYQLGTGGSYTNYGPFSGTSITFDSGGTGGDGTYYFYSVGTDLAGNVEAPPTGPDHDTFTLVDTAGPSVTSFLVNGTDTYTNSTSVQLSMTVTDVVDMEFSNDNVTWSGYVAYAPTYPWTLVAPDGTKTVYAHFRDSSLIVTNAQDDIVLDTAAPGPVTDLTALRGNDKVTLGWTNPGEGETECAVWRAVWHTGDNTTSAYPEYDDTNPTEPAWPADRAAALASAEWDSVDSIVPPLDAYLDDSLDRGIYYYVVYPRDEAGNWGDGAQVSSISYLLGDIGGDGAVTGADITVLGSAYGTSDGPAPYNNECDVGPTDDYSGAGVPDTDDLIDFDDLMIFALNWDETVTKTLPTEGSRIAVFSWVKIDETTRSLVLAEPCANLKGLNLSADLPQGAVLTVTAGELLGRQDSFHFLQNIPEHGLDAGLALMGHNACITGQGELIRINLAAGHEPGDILITARNSANEELEYTLDESTTVPDTPTRYSISANYPNPFNPMTKIDFALPEPQRVQLSIFTVDGRRIATLANESMPAGHHTVTWTGRDDRGEPVASGIYFYRIQAGDFCRTEKMTLLK